MATVKLIRKDAPAIVLLKDEAEYLAQKPTYDRFYRVITSPDSVVKEIEKPKEAEKPQLVETIVVGQPIETIVADESEPDTIDLSLSVAKLRSIIDTASVDALKQALEGEMAKEKPRATIIDLINKRLKD